MDIQIAGRVLASGQASIKLDPTSKFHNLYFLSDALIGSNVLSDAEYPHWAPVFALIPLESMHPGDRATLPYHWRASARGVVYPTPGRISLYVRAWRDCATGLLSRPFAL